MSAPKPRHKILVSGPRDFDHVLERIKLRQLPLPNHICNGIKLENGAAQTPQVTNMLFMRSAKRCCRSLITLRAGLLYELRLCTKLYEAFLSEQICSTSYVPSEEELFFEHMLFSS